VLFLVIISNYSLLTTSNIDIIVLNHVFARNERIWQT